MSYGDSFVLTLFTADPELAAAADAAGVDRIGVDLETLGKHGRQGHLNTWISDHRIEDLPRIAARLHSAQLFARCNPVHEGSAEEIDALLALGVRVLMLPYFKEAAEAERFIRLVDGRAHPVLLLETAAAAGHINELCRIDGVAEIHIGLNDMRLSLGWNSHFDVLVSDLIERLCDAIRAAGLRLGVGGLGRAGDNDLPVPADLVAAQLARLGATAALVSRAFFRPPMPADLALEVRRLRQYLQFCSEQSDDWLAQRKLDLQRAVAALRRG